MSRDWRSALAARHAAIISECHAVSELRGKVAALWFRPPRAHPDLDIDDAPELAYALGIDVAIAVAEIDAVCEVARRHPLW